MNYNSQIQKAIHLAALWHKGQTRKNDRTPYIVHPVGVAWILSDVTDDEDIICAGLLHDVLEDVSLSKAADIEREFGKRTLQMVQDVSEDKDPESNYDEKATWKERKEKYLAHLAKASDEAKLVSCADKIHNLSCLLEDHRRMGDTIWKNFNATPTQKLWYEQEVLKLVSQGELVSCLITTYVALIEELRKVVKGQ
jgi:(p)ppGpp synthase/HD superfamily hydrolase